MTDLVHLLHLEQQTPNDDKLLSKIAFAYLTTPFIKSDELTYFKKAYKANPSIKNTHNYAFWLYDEYGDYQLAGQLFDELLTKSIKSHYPYMAYAQFLLGGGRSSKNFYRLKDNAPILIQTYHTAICQFQKLDNYYQNNHQNEWLFMHANLANVYMVADDFKSAKLHYQRSLELLKQCNDNHISQAELDEWGYFIYYNLLICSKLENNKIEYDNLLNKLTEFESFYKGDIYALKRKSSNNLKRLLRYFYKCYLLGCEHCGNLIDDEMC